MEPDTELQRTIDIVNGLAGVLDRLSQMLRTAAMAEKQPTPSTLLAPYTALRQLRHDLRADVTTRCPQP